MNKNLYLILFFVIIIIKNSLAQSGISYQNTTIYATTNVGITAKVKWVPGFSNTAVGSHSVDNGITNTQDIVNTLGGGTYAAEICDDLIESGFSDWYLPSADELLVVRANTATLGISLNNDYYWSSTEYAPNWSQTQALGVYGTVQGLVKTFANAYVVCVRKEPTGNPMIFSEVVHNGQTLQVYPIDNALSVNQSTSINICNNLDAFGYDDWYLPIDNEALAISSQLQPFQFPNTGATTQIYWTATAGKALYGSYTPTYTSSTYFKCRCVRQKVPILNITANNISCSGNNNGSIAATIVDGSGNYTYSWSNGATASTISNLSSGQYTITATDVTNNTVLIETVTITEPSPILVTANVTNATCNGNNNGTAQLNITGGTGMYNTTWTNNANPNALTAGTYTATITDANGCTEMETIIITEPSPILVTANVTNATCNGNNNGIAQLNITGGTGMYNTTWINNANPNALTAGTYTATITDANGCTETETIIITDPSEILINYILTDVSCFGANDGSVNFSFTGGTPPFVTNFPAGTNPNLLLAGDYQIIITDANNCLLTDTFTIDSPNDIIVNAILVDATSNTAQDGSINITVNGDFAPFSYTWNNGDTTSNITGLSSGTYTVTITDANNCTYNRTYVIDNPTSTDAANMVNRLEVYPNPSKNILNIHLNLAENTIVELELIDAFGRTIEHQKKYGQFIKTRLMVGHYPEGIYALKIKINEDYFVQQVLIKH
ncbi:MAG: T9SS type A sorting domain-containing protein [Saprospiraceae bacterium]